jgi:hypothetical protein
MASANEWLLEESIRHALDLRQYENGIVRRLIAVLNRSDSRLFAELTEKLEHLGPDSFSVERLDALLASVRALNTEAFEAVQRELTQTLKEFTDSEVAYQRQMLVTALPVQVSVASVSAESVYAAALARPFQGVLLREVWKDLDAQRMKQVRQTIAQGFVEGRTTAQIIRDLRGTRAKGYADGLVNRSRRDVESVVRTAMGHYAGFVADRSMEANGDLVKAVMWVSTLDLRTTPECQARDGKQYTPDTHKPIGHSLPWLGGPGRLHWNAVPEGATVRTNRGDVPIEMVSVGDLVLTHVGRFMPVLAKRAKLNESGVIRVAHTDSGRVLRATDDHPILTASGWKFMGALEVGDKMFRDPESLGEVAAVSCLVNPEPEDCPTKIDDSDVAINRTLELVAANIDFESNHEVGAREIEDVAVSLILSDPLSIKGDQCLQHHFLALAHVLGKYGCHRLSELLAGFFREWFPEHAATGGGVTAVDSVGLRNTAGNTRHATGVVSSHQVTVHGVFSGCLFSESERPMISAGRGGAQSSIEVFPGLLFSGSHRDAVNDGELRESPVCESVFALNPPEREALGNVKFCDQSGVVDFAHDQILSLELSQYDGMVYDIEVAEDSSYLCNGLIVSNCRSHQVPVTKSWRDLGVDMDEFTPGSRASMDGQVPAETTYPQWLEKQSAARQDQVLGPTRGRLYRDGNLPVDRMYDNKGAFITLEELRARDAEAFKRAGL